jgi:hypothetical protein
MAEKPVNPYVSAGLDLADIGISVIGMILQQGAVDEAKSETRAIDDRNFNYQLGRDSEADKMNREQLKIQKGGLALNQKQFDFSSMMTKYGVTQDMVTKVGNILNTDTALKNRTLQTWGK